MIPTSSNATAERIGGPDRTRAVSAELLDVGAVAALLDCSPRHVYRLSDAGRMPRPVKLGSLVRWSRVCICSWIEGGCKSVRTPGRAAQ